MKLWGDRPAAPEPVEALCAWFDKRHRLRNFNEPREDLDVSDEPVVLLRPRLGEVVWDPGPASAAPKVEGAPSPSRDGTRLTVERSSVPARWRRDVS